MRVVPAAALTLALLAGATAPAGASTNTHHDAARDVSRYDYRTKHTVTDTANRTADITSATVTHRKRVVLLSLRLRELSAPYFLLVWQIQLAGHHGRDSVGLVNLKGVHQFTVQNAQGRTLPCPGLQKKLSRKHDLVQFVVPRSCLGTPRWVRAGAAMEVEDYKHNRTYDDLSHRRGTARVDPNKIPLGPRLYVG